MDYKRKILLFEYFFFSPLGYDELKGYSPECHVNTGVQLTRGIYRVWVSKYLHKAQLFYQSQYRRHQELTWLSFCQHYQIPDYENPDNLGFDYEWADWKENYQLNNHYDKYQVAIQELLESGNMQPDLDDLRTNESLSDELATYKEIDKIWFDRLINNPSEVIAKLRSISYEKYLETTHWKKIRAALILINAAICQAEPCSLVGESWYGGNESDLEIHHLDYSNRGNERFNDLAVLCKRHHELMHQSQNGLGKP